MTTLTLQQVFFLSSRKVLLSAVCGINVLLFSLLCDSVRASPALTPHGIVGWWPGDGNAVDIVSGNNGTLGGGASYGAGEVNQGFYFPGTGIVSVLDSSELDLSQVTMEAWISLDSLPISATDFSIVTKGISPTTENYGLYLTSSGDLVFEWYNGGFNKVQSTGPALTTGENHHVAVTANGSTIRFFQDGQLMSSHLQAAPLIANNSPLQIGNATPFGNRFDGVIDELSVYDLALGASELQSIFAAGSDGKIRIEWIDSGSGAWSDTGKWRTGTIPNGANTAVQFGREIASPATVTLDVHVDIGEFYFANDTHSYTLAGDGVHTFSTTANSSINVVSGSHTISAPIQGSDNLSKSGTGSLTLAGTNTYSGSTTVTAGSLRIHGAHLGGGAYTVNAGATLGGDGLIQAPVTVNGKFSPGSSPSSPGNLDIDDTLTLTPNSVLEIEIGGVAPGSEHDLVNVSGTFEFSGRLDLPLVFIDGFFPAVGDEITILNASTVTGDFRSIFSENLVDFIPGAALEIVQSPTSIELHFVPPKTDIQFDAATTTADWESPSTWDTGVVPELQNIISIQNMAGSSQRVEVTTEDALVHQLTVDGSIDEVTLSVMNGHSLSAIVGTTVCDQATVELDGGSIVSKDVVIENGGGLIGNGVVVGKLTIGDGVNGTAMLSPGIVSAGKIDVEGDYQQQSNGELMIEVEGPNTFDTLAITGDATLGGTLEVMIEDIADAPAGTMIEVLTADSVTSTFDNVILSGEDDLYLIPVYGSNFVALTTYEEGDMNPFVPGIGEEDAEAFSLALTDPVAYRNMYGISADEAGDIDDIGNNGLDFDDIDDFVKLLNEHIGGSMTMARMFEIIADVQAVPEPTSITLVLGLCCFLQSRTSSRKYSISQQTAGYQR